MRLPRWALALLIGIVGCGGGSETASPDPSEFPNVVLITVDTFRFDRVGPERGLTPNIDRLASRGTVFERAVTPIGTTFPALATVLTGLHPREHGVRQNSHTLSAEFATLAEVLQAQGYDTGAFISFHDAVRGGGMGQGFATLVEVHGNEHVLPATRVNEQAVPWLQEPRDQPLFLWVHYYEPHSPYRLTPHAKKNEQWLTGDYRDGATVKEFYQYSVPGFATEENRRAVNLLYDGEVVEADRAVGEILSAVEGLSPQRDTVVILTADHGQLLGEHRLVGHGGVLWEEILAVPLIVWDSRRTRPQRTDTRVGLIDLFPTIHELVGLPVPEGLPGRSFAAALIGEPISDVPYFAESRFPPPPSVRLAVTWDDRRLYRIDEKWSLYELGSDPSEAQPLEPTRQDRDLQSLIQRFDDLDVSQVTDNAALDPKRLARLEALGYAGSRQTSDTTQDPASPKAEAAGIHVRYRQLLRSLALDGTKVVPTSQLPDSKRSTKEALLAVWGPLMTPAEKSDLRQAILLLSFFREGVVGTPELDEVGPDGQAWRPAVEEEMRALTRELAELRR